MFVNAEFLEKFSKWKLSTNICQMENFITGFFLSFILFRFELVVEAEQVE